MFTGGVGGLVELPNFTVLVQGLEEWNYSRVLGTDPVIHEPRVLAAARSRLGTTEVKELRNAPWMEGQSSDPNSPANQVGVPVVPFPAWFRCTYCDLLGSLESGAFTFTNKVASRPFEAQFAHTSCARRDRFAVPARFLVGCLRGHLDEFPYSWWVHKGGACPKHAYPALKMRDFGRESAATVRIECVSCEATRNMQEAQGEAGKANLPQCRGRHPHLGQYSECPEQARLLVLGASNQWFGASVDGLAVPPPQASELEAVLELLWEPLSMITSYEVMVYAHGAQFADQLGRWPLDEVWAAVQTKRARGQGAETAADAGDLLSPEWELLTSEPPQPTADFAIVSQPAPPAAAGVLADVRQVERLRLVRALVGFTRFDAPDPDDPELVIEAPLSGSAAPTWLPATEVRGEGLFVRLDEQALEAWEARAVVPWLERQHRDAFATFRLNRYSDRLQLPPGHDWSRGWPGLRYYLVHSLAHIALRAISLECGYAAASLAERIYADPTKNMAGFLIYTAVPDAEGTLGGLVSLGEPDRFQQVLERALADARACSSDPICAETAPAPGSDATYAACCHVCMFLSETSCERGNRFLDRRLLVDIGWPELALWP